ncbi:MAG: BatA domain-containing protein [Planctomycetes bacterium]|nr:BatA domain-containing protein [Planctomycetota bacterium]
MSFLNPIFLVGLLSAAIPLIIHLSRSRRTKKIRFSTTRFLTDQFLQSYRMSRLKELLLLAARMALCALFAMAEASSRDGRHCYTSIFIATKTCFNTVYFLTYSNALSVFRYLRVRWWTWWCLKYAR